jgi:hypothetical protein
LVLRFLPSLSYVEFDREQLFYRWRKYGRAAPFVYSLFCTRAAVRTPERSTGGTLVGILVPVTQRLCDPPSTRPARGRGTSANGHSGRAGDRRATRGSLSSQWAAAPTTTTDGAARYPSTGWKIPASSPGDWTGRPTSSFWSPCRRKPCPHQGVRANPETQ